MIVLPGQLGDISIYGQESNPTTRGFAIMNLALRGIKATAMRDSAMLKCKAILQSVSKAKDNFGPENADTFRRLEMANAEVRMWN